MSTSTTTTRAKHVPKEAGLLACRMANSFPGALHYEGRLRLGKTVETLFELKAFSEGFRDQYPSISDEDGNDIPLTMDDEGNWQYFHCTLGWITVDPKEITRHRFNIDWLINLICRDLDIAQTSPRETMIADYAWHLGQAPLSDQLKPTIFFVRCFDEKPIFEQLYHWFEQRTGMKKGIVLTASGTLPLGTSLPGHHYVMAIPDCLSFNTPNFHIDQSRLKAKFSDIAMTNGPFSSDYRKAQLGDTLFEFTPKQAAFIEALHKNGRMHKHQLMIAAGSKQDDPYNLFRKGKEMHPAWGTLIKHDHQGFYWLQY